MNEYTTVTKKWLDERYDRGVAEGRYEAHRPIYGFGVQPSERNHTMRMTIAYAILQQLNRINGSTLVDIGGGEGYIAALAKKFLGIDSIMTELSDNACTRCNELFSIPALPADIHGLPFEDNSIDIVILSEVIEHLFDPVQGLMEAYRVARKAVVITTLECSPYTTERWCRMSLRDLDKSHAERTYFHPDDFRAIFGSNVETLNASKIVGMMDETQISRDEAAKLIPKLAERKPYEPDCADLMVVIWKDQSSKINPKIDEEKLFQNFFNFAVPLPNVYDKSEIKLPAWVKFRDPKLPPVSHPKKFDYERFTVSHNGLVRLVLTVILVLLMGIRFLTMKGSIFAKIQWVFKFVSFRKIGRVLGLS